MNDRRLIRRFSKGIVVIAFLLIAVSPPLAYPAVNADFSGMSIQEMSGKAPDLSIRAGKKELRLSEYRGKVVMLHFWARCSACMHEMPTLESLYRRFGKKGLVFIAITTEPKSHSSGINEMAKRLGITFPIYYTADGNVPESYWFGGEPQTYFVDRKGDLVGRAFGPRDWRSKEATALVSGLLK